MWRSVCVHLYVTAKEGRGLVIRWSRQKNYRERVKGDPTFNNSWWTASDVISHSSDVVSISPDESLIYNYLRFSPVALSGVWGFYPLWKQRDGEKQTSVQVEGVEEEDHRLEIAVYVLSTRKGCTLRYNPSQIWEIRLEELVDFINVSFVSVLFLMINAFLLSTLGLSYFSGLLTINRIK